MFKRVEEETLRDFIEECKNKLITKFIENPNYFWRETDMHCYLYNELLKNQTFIYRDRENGEISLVRREYPTNLKYSYSVKNKKKIYFPVEQYENKRHGKLDIAIIENPINKNIYGFNKIAHGIELKFEARQDTDGKTKNTEKNLFPNIHKDFIMLTDKDNEIDFGHILYFSKEENTRFKKLDDIVNHLDSEKAKYNVNNIDLSLIKFTYVEINKNEKSRVISDY